MTSSSNAPPPHNSSAQTHEHQEYLNALNANVSNFVSVKLSSEGNYHLWEAQMLGLLESYRIRYIVVDELTHQSRKQYDTLVKAWIFGSISERLLGTVVNLDSAKKVWDELKSFYAPTMISSQQVEHADSAEKTKVLEGKTKTEDKDKDRDRDPTERRTQDTDAILADETKSTEDKDATETENKEAGQVEKKADGDKDRIPKANPETKDIKNNKLWKTILEGDWWEVRWNLREGKVNVTEAINSDGNTVLHIAVGISRYNHFVSELLSLIKGTVDLTKLVNVDGSTPLHIAAIVGNTEAANLLIKKDRRLLEIRDLKLKTPLHKAYEYRHLDTILHLINAAKDDQGKTSKKKSSPSENSTRPPAGEEEGVKSSSRPAEEVGVDLLVQAISAKNYDLATKLLKKFPEFAVKDDSVLMAIAKTFPTGLDYSETFIYPIMEETCERIVERTTRPFIELVDFFESIENFYMYVSPRWNPFDGITEKITNVVATALIGCPLMILILIYLFIRSLISMVHFPCFMCYYLLWNFAARVDGPIKHIVKKKKEWENAIEVLNLVCDQIDNKKFPHYYKKPILEAARQNAIEVVIEILTRSPEAIQYTDESGYDIIQLAVIHRSEKIYNLIYIIWESKSQYRTIEDSSENNMLHLAGKLAPSHKLKRRTGAAFQLQRELQWREEVKKLVFPTYITKENIFKETPDMVFTQEHENLVKAGEKWMKAVAESCSITAALITTIVFAAAITVPGGSNQNTGLPLFTEDIAFIIFAMADAISLFASSTALLMFLSILTGRFAEQDFLVSLPRRLIIGLCALMLSATAMMVGFGTTLFLVFCGRKPWMLAPICVSAFLPIASFGTLQIPLIVDLLRSTEVRIFGNQVNNDIQRFDPYTLQLYFPK